MKKVLLALALLVSATGASLTLLTQEAVAQTAGQSISGFLLAQGSTYGSFTCPSANLDPCFVQYGSTLPISGTISASLAGFTPTAGATANITDIVNTSQDVALPAGTDIVVTNKGSVDINFRIQAGAGVAVSTDQPLKAGAAVGIHLTTATHLSAIAPTGTGTGSTAGQLNIQGGTGLAAGYGGGSSGSSTNASVGTNGSANPASSTQVGVSDGTNLQKVVAPIGLGDGVNGNNMVSTGSWVWNGTTWDRMPGTAAGGVKITNAGVAQGSTTSGQTVQPIGCRTLSSLPTDTTAQTNMPACTTSGELSTHDATLATLAAEGVGNTAASVPAQAIYMGCRAATAQPTAVTDGQLVGPMCGTGGKIVTDPYAPSSFRVSGTATSTDTGAHTIIAAGAGSLKNYITGVQCGRTDAGTSAILITFSDAQSTKMVIPDAGNGGGNNMQFASPIVTAAATAFTFTSGTGVTTAYCNAQGFQAP